MNIKFDIVKSEILNNSCDCLVVFITKQPDLLISCVQVSNLVAEPINRRFEAGDLIEKQGKSVVLYDIEAIENKKLMLIYVDSMEMTRETYIELCQQIISESKKIGATSLGIALDGVNVHAQEVSYLSQTLVEAVLYDNYQFEVYKETTDQEYTFEKLSIFLADGNQADIANIGLKKGKAIGIGKNLARDLGNMPPNVCHPTYLAEKALDMAKCNQHLSTSIIDEDEMEKLGMMSFLSVGLGSEQPSKLIVMEYNNAPKNERPYALVGKGITFDSGGISIKPGAALDEMKFDMCGAAAVFGVMESVLQLQLPINLICIAAAAENMPSSGATRPGDIIKSMSGKTIEILNTDAEGRLVLCDALTYVQKYNPKTIIDIATLTGACIVALGEHASGLLSNDDAFAKTLLESGIRSGDKLWQLPLWPEYTKKLKSPFADLANLGSPGAGTITAACFLSEFVKDQTWAHIDIAGVAWVKGDNKGATGKPVGLLVDYLASRPYK